MKDILKILIESVKIFRFSVFYCKHTLFCWDNMQKIKLFQVSTSTTLAARTTTRARRKLVIVTGMFFVKKMYRDLLTGYDTRVRPVQNQSKPVYVNTKFVPNALIDFDNANQKLSMMAYIRIHWVDEQIIWKPKRYGGRFGLRAPLHEVWTPNIVLHKVSSNLFHYVSLKKCLYCIRYWL